MLAAVFANLSAARPAKFLDLCERFTGGERRSARYLRMGEGTAAKFGREGEACSMSSRHFHSQKASG